MLLLLVACHPASSITLAGDSGADSGAGEDSSETLPGNPDPDDTADTGEKDDKDAIYDAFFDPATIQTIDLTLTRAAVSALNANGRAYVEGDAVINGEAFLQVGVRLKGSSTYEDLDCADGYCKASLKIKLDEYVVDQKLGTLQRITLNNMTTDLSQGKEVVVYDILGQESQLASRCSYARVTINGEPWGLYANVESVDDEWAQRRFDDPSGNLWGTSASYGDFIDSGFRGGWVNKSGEGDFTQIAAVKAQLDAYTGDFFGDFGPLVNVDQFLDYWAWCAALGNYDGYPFHLNDVIMYEDPEDDHRMVFAPWGTDETWDQYEYTGQTWYVVYGRLGVACLQDPACVAELQARIGTATDGYDAVDAMGLSQAAWDLSEADVQADPKRPFTPDYVWAARDALTTVIPGYGDYVRNKAGI